VPKVPAVPGCRCISAQGAKVLKVLRRLAKFGDVSTLHGARSAL
jgi:hypothetical protein